jgi:ubiquinone/menaquinone biosynthesis C-methylase UbiE
MDVRGLVASNAATYWDGRFRHEAACVRDWLEIPYVRRHYIDPAITGSDTTDWFTFACERWLRPAGWLLELGCGANGVAFDAVRLGVVHRALGVDVSRQAIAVSQDRAQSQGLADRLEYRCADATELEFPNDTFDAVIVTMALHHMVDLERLLAGVRRWKRVQGPFVVNEYVGPDRFQWTDATLREGQRILESLDERYRRHGVTGEVIRSFTRPRYADMVTGDPSEAIRSSAIVPLLETYFDIVERRPYGGTILHWLLADLAHNFEPERRPEDAATLDRLFEEERRLLREGVIEDNFAVILAR